MSFILIRANSECETAVSKQVVSFEQLVESERLAADWAEALSPVEDEVMQLYDFLERENKNGRASLPAKENLLRAFRDPLQDVRVLIVGQDPYPTPGHAVGLAFAVERDVRPIPRSLKNIYHELHNDVGVSPSEHGDLSGWTTQGVMLLNRVLSVQEGKPGSHAGIGWEKVTDHAIKVLIERPEPLIAILWGNQARAMKPLLIGAEVVESAHPSPLSAKRGFFGSKPFSRVNKYLLQHKMPQIDWEIK